MNSWKILPLFFFISGIGSLKKSLAQGWEFERYYDTLKQHFPQFEYWEMQEKSAKEAVRFAMELPSTLVGSESPTGMFYAIGITQNFQMPGIYAKKKQIAEIDVALTEKQNLLDELGWKQTLRNVYANVQADLLKERQLKILDSLYVEIKRLEESKNQAGGSNMEALSLSLLEYERIHLAYLEVKIRANAGKLWLTKMARIEGNWELADISVSDASIFPKVEMKEHPSIELWKLQMAKKQKELLMNRWISSSTFYVGYLNQGMQETPGIYRWNGGINIPLFIGANRAKVRSIGMLSNAMESAMKAKEIENNAIYEQTINQWVAYKNIWNSFKGRQENLADSLVQAGYLQYQVGYISANNYYRLMDNYTQVAMNKIDIWVKIKELESTLLYYQNQ